MRGGVGGGVGGTVSQIYKGTWCMHGESEFLSEC